MLFGAFAITASSVLTIDAEETTVISEAVVSDSTRAQELIAQAIEHGIAGRNAQTLQAYQRAWRWDPTRADALLPIPALAAKLNRLDTAARYALIVVRGDGTEAVSSNLALYRRLATHAAKQGEHALAAELGESLYDLTAAGGKSPLLQQKLALEIGRQWFLSGNAVEASDWFHRVTEETLEEVLSQDALRLLEGFASCHLEAERFDRAEQTLRQLSEFPGGTSRAAYWQARLALDRDQPAVALEKINECLAAEDTGLNGLDYQLLAKSLRATNQVDRAAEELQRFHEDRPDDPAAWLAWIDQLIASGDKAKALEQSELLLKTTLIKLDEEDLSAWDNTVLADAAGQQIKLLGSVNRPDELWPLLIKLTAWWGVLEPVNEPLEQALSHEPLAKSARFWLATLVPDKMSLDELAVAGRVAMIVHLTKKAARFYQPLITRSVTLDSQRAEDSLPATAWLYDWLSGLEEWSQMIEVIEWARKEKIPEADSAKLSYWLALGLVDAEQPEKALTAIQSARQLVPKNLLYAQSEASLLAQLHRFDEAIAVATAALESVSQEKNAENDETVQSVRRRLATWLDERAALGDRKQADALLETNLDALPLDPWTNNDLAYSWAERGVHLDRSLRMAQIAVESDPENASWADTLGWVFYHLGRHQEAALELRRAIDLLSETEETAGFAVLYEHLAAALEAIGDTDGASEAKAKAQRLRELEEPSHSREEGN